MGYMEELRDLWSRQERGNLEIMIQEALTLLQKAKDAGETVPTELELEILLAANYSIGFGSSVDESTHLFHLLINLEQIEGINQDILARYICTCINSLLGIMASDTQNGTRSANAILQPFGIQPSSTRAMLLKKVIYLGSLFASHDSISSWNLELLSYLITIYSMLEVLGKLSPEDTTELDYASKIFDSTLPNDEEAIVQKWRGEWLQKSDYFRFTNLMIFGTHAGEDTWIDNAKYLTGLT